MHPRAIGYRGRPLREPAPAEKAIGGGASPYKAGKAFENSVRSQLRRRGYFVIRSYASKGLVDEVAVGHGRALFVQCKRRGVLGSREHNELYELAVQHGAVPILAMKLSERVTGYFELTGLREFRSRARPMVRIDPLTCEAWPEQLACV